MRNVVHNPVWQRIAKIRSLSLRASRVSWVPRANSAPSRACRPADNSPSRKHRNARAARCSIPGFARRPFRHAANARTARAHSCGISPPDVPTLERHHWVFNPLDESNSPQTIPPTLTLLGSFANGTTFLVILSLSCSLVLHSPYLPRPSCLAWGTPWQLFGPSLAVDGIHILWALACKFEAQFVTLCSMSREC